MDIIETLKYLRPNDSPVFPLGVEPILSNVVWLTQRTYTSEKDVSKLNTTWNADANVYTETPFTIPTQQECEDYWTTTLQNELTLKSLRRERDTLLTQTDKYVIPDWPHASVETANAWVTYRQALRDLPSVTEDPANPVWPVQPSP